MKFVAPGLSGTGHGVEDAQQLGQAWRELQARKGEWCGRFPRELSVALSAASSAALSEGGIDKLQAQASPNSPKEATLSLADDTQPDGGCGLVPNSRIVGRELKAIYIEIAALLEGASMELAEYRVLLTPSGPGADDDKAKADADEEAGKGDTGDGKSEGKPLAQGCARRWR